MIGGHELRVFPSSGDDGVRVATIGRFAFEPQALDGLARDIIGSQRDFWDADRGSPFLVTGIPLVSRPSQISYGGTGLGDAFALWIDQGALLDRLRWLLAHEYLHGWIPGRLGKAAADRDEHASQLWFSEGLTDYYARALLVREGQIPPDEFVDQWNDVLRAYTMSPARNLSGDEALGISGQAPRRSNSPISAARCSRRGGMRGYERTAKAKRAWTTFCMPRSPMRA